MKPEYHEGPKALENFEKTMTALFRAPKTVTAKKVAKKKAKGTLLREISEGEAGNFSSECGPKETRVRRRKK